MRNISINLLIDGVRDASKSLRRDYLELENLQGSKRGTDAFVAKAKIRSLENLQKSLGKYYKNIISQELAAKELDSNLASEEDVNANANVNTNDIIFVEALEGTDNFSRAIPFFAILVTVLRKKESQYFAEKAVMNFPALGETYHTEKGKGAWLQKELGNFSGTFRLRISKTDKLDDIIVGCDHARLAITEKLSSNIRMFGSCSYQIATLISGKSDCEIIPYKPLLCKGFELFIYESGGGAYVKNNIVAASSYVLQEKLKQII